MKNTYITAGELAKIAGTTKRTIQFYDTKGVLKPTKVNDKGYRYYQEKQVLEYQMILLLTTLGVPLTEIRTYLEKSGELTQLFQEKQQAISQQIKRLEFNLTNLKQYLANLDTNHTLIDPHIETLASFSVFYIEKVGAYAQIGNYCQELKTMFQNPGRHFTTLAIFTNPTYQPKQSLIYIGVLAEKKLRVKPKYRQQVKMLTFDPGKVITYTYRGPGEMLSLFWKQIEQYCSLNHIRVRKNTPDFEIYRHVDIDTTKQIFEIYLPIE